MFQHCTKDLGADDVDPIFGQGLLDFSCVAQPSGGLRLPITQQPRPPVNCARGATVIDGRHYTDIPGAPKCFAHLLAEVDNLQGAGAIPSGARGAAILYGFFFDEQDQNIFLNANGFDGNYYLTNFTHSRLSAINSGTESLRTYLRFSPVEPSAIISLIPTGSEGRGTGNVQLSVATRAGRTGNPLIKTARYAGQKAIINMAFGNSYGDFQQIINELENKGVFVRAPNHSWLSVAPGLIGVTGIYGSGTTSKPGFREVTTTLLHVSAQGSLPASLGTALVDRDGNRSGSIELNTELTDLIAQTTTKALIALTQRTAQIGEAFPDASDNQRSLLASASSVRIQYACAGNTTNLLDMLACATVHSRRGDFYTATYLNREGNALAYNTPCGILRDGCFVLPYYQTDNGWNGTSFAAARLTAMIDTLWLIWPDLSKQQMHSLLSSCSEDKGASGVDPIYGQGLLDFTCLVHPSGGVRIAPNAVQAQALTQPASRAAHVEGLQGALYGASTASKSLTGYDAFDRDFEHRVLHRSLQARPAFDPMYNALAHRPYSFLELTASREITSTWLLAQAGGKLHFALGVAYEGGSLFGMRGSGHFEISDGRSIGVRMELKQPMHNFWSLRLNIAHYRGTASAAFPGAVSDLALAQSNASITLERKFTSNAHLHLKASCSSGNSGSFNSFGTRIELFGVASCYRTIGAEIRW